MTRIVVARENASPFPGTFIMRNCFKLPDGVEEFTVAFAARDYERVGIARRFERDEETGAVSFDIQLDEDLPMDEANFALWADGLIESRTGDVRNVHEATIRHVAYLNVGAIPFSVTRSQ